MQKRTMNILYIYITEADRLQMAQLAVGLEKTRSICTYSVAVTENIHTYSLGISQTLIDIPRPPHVLAHYQSDSVGSRGGVLEMLGKVLRRLLDLDPVMSLRTIRALLLAARRYRKKRTEAEGFLARHRIDVVVTGTDIQPWSLPILAAAKAQGCKTVLARGANIILERLDEGHRHSVKHNMRAHMGGTNLDRPAPSMAAWLCGIYISRVSPTNVEPSVWGRLSAYLPSDLIALRLARCLPGSLWRIGTPWTDLILASGDDEMEAIRNLCIDERRIAKVGSVVFQEIYEQLHRRDGLRETVCTALNLSPDRPIVMVTPTASWEHLCATYDQQFTHFRRLIDILCKSGAQVIATLHPLARPADYQVLADEFGFKILDRSLLDCVVIADVFVGSDYSSVIRWGLAVGIPTMNMEFNPQEITLRLRSDYPTIRDFDEFSRWLEDVLAEAPIPTERLLEVRPRPLGLLVDGKFFSQLSSAIDGLMEERGDGLVREKLARQGPCRG